MLGHGFVGFGKHKESSNDFIQSPKPELNPSAQTILDYADLMGKVHLQTEGAAGS